MRSSAGGSGASKLVAARSYKTNPFGALGGPEFGRKGLLAGWSPQSCNMKPLGARRRVEAESSECCTRKPLPGSGAGRRAGGSALPGASGCRFCKTNPFPPGTPGAWRRGGPWPGALLVLLGLGPALRKGKGATGATGRRARGTSSAGEYIVEPPRLPQADCLPPGCTGRLTLTDSWLRRESRRTAAGGGEEPSASLEKEGLGMAPMGGGCAMASRERVPTAPSHREPERVTVDLGGTDVARMPGDACRGLRSHELTGNVSGGDVAPRAGG